MTDWEEIGKGDRECQNPPEIGEHDHAVYRWTLDYVSGFTMGAGLLSGLIADLKLKGDEKRVFIKKVGMIYSTFLKIEREEAQSKREADA